MIQNSIVSAEYQPNPAINQNAAPHARMRKKNCHCTCREYAYVYVGAIESRAGVVFLVLF